MDRRKFLKLSTYSVPVAFAMAGSGCGSEFGSGQSSHLAAVATGPNGLVWNLRYDQVPVFRSQLASQGAFDKDAITIQKWAVDTLNNPAKGKFVVRGGGHSFIGTSVAPNCDVLDLSPFNNVVIDTSKQFIRVGGGTLFIKIARALAKLPSPSFIPSGDCPTVGIGGFLSGGGYSRLSGFLGLGVDKVQSLTAITFRKNGNTYVSEIVNASPTENSDLFWAMLGGGPRYAIIADVTLRYEVLSNHSVVGLKTGVKNEADFKKAFGLWEDLLANKTSATNSLNFQIDRFHNISCLGAFSNAGDDRAKILAFASAIGATADIRPLNMENLEIVLAGCESLATCDVKSWSSSKVYKAGKSRMIEKAFSLSSDDLSKIYQKIGTSPANWGAYQFNPWNGAIKTANPKVSFPWRNYAYEVQLSCDIYNKNDWKDSYLDWVDGAMALLGNRNAAFFNHINRDIIMSDKPLYFGASWDRLQSIKAVRDPANVFPIFREGTTPR